MDRQEILRFLRQQPIINSWPQSEIEKLAGEMDDVSYPAEKEVTPPEYQAEDAYIVYSGKLRQSIFTTEGRERSFRPASTIVLLSRHQCCGRIVPDFSGKSY